MAKTVDSRTRYGRPAQNSRTEGLAGETNCFTYVDESAVLRSILAKRTAWRKFLSHQEFDSKKANCSFIHCKQSRRRRQSLDPPAGAPCLPGCLKSGLDAGGAGGRACTTKVAAQRKFVTGPWSHAFGFPRAMLVCRIDPTWGRPNKPSGGF